MRGFCFRVAVLDASKSQFVACTAMLNLAGTYSALGRHNDALALQEKTLEFWRRVLPKNHPKIGAQW